VCGGSVEGFSLAWITLFPLGPLGIRSHRLRPNFARLILRRFFESASRKKKCLQSQRLRFSFGERTLPRTYHDTFLFHCHGLAGPITNDGRMQFFTGPITNDGRVQVFARRLTGMNSWQGRCQWITQRVSQHRSH
jgi:hypothetical protein